MSYNYTCNFETYKIWKDVIPRALTSPFLLHIFVSNFLFLVHCLGSKFHKLQIFYTMCLWIDDFFFDLLYPYTKVVFQNSLKKIRNHGTETPVLRLHGYRFYGTLTQISSVTSLVMASSFLAFWDTFLIKQTFVCDPRLDCFIRPSFAGIAILHIPLESCTYATENVVCFEFVYDIVGGFSSAIGVLGVSVLHFNMSLSVFFWFKKLYHTRLSKRWFKLCCSYTSYIVFCVQFLVYISWIVLIFTVPVITNIFLLSDLAGVKGVAYFWGLISLFMYIPIVYSFVDEKSLSPQELPNQMMEIPLGDSDSQYSQDPPNKTSLVMELSWISQDPPNNEQSLDNEAESDFQDPIRHHMFEHQDSPNNEMA